MEYKKYADGGRAKRIAAGGSDGGKDASSWNMPASPDEPATETFATYQQATLERPVGGKNAKKRLDKYARGGKVKGAKTNVTVIVAPQSGAEKEPLPIPVPPPQPNPNNAAGPGGGNPGMTPGSSPVPGAPAGLPMAAKGGKIVKRRFGGPVMKYGSGGGEGRMEKARKSGVKPLKGDSGLKGS